MATGVSLALVSAPNALAAATVLPVVSCTAVALRFYSRFRRRVERGPDDWLTIPAAVLLIGMSVCLITSVELGLTQFVAPVSPTDLDPKHVQDAFTSSAKSLWSFQLQLYPAHCLIKLSILLFYRRLFFSRHASWMRAHDLLQPACITIGTVVILWSLAFFLLNVLDCGIDVSLNWAPLPLYIASCSPGIALERGFAISDIAIDIMLLLLPLPTIWRGSLPRPRKIAVTGVLLMGFASLAASIPRLVLYVSQVDTETFSNLGSLTSYFIKLWATMQYWSVIEANLALIAACLPTLWSLLPQLQANVSSGGRRVDTEQAVSTVVGPSVTEMEERAPRRGRRHRSSHIEGQPAYSPDRNGREQGEEQRGRKTSIIVVESINSSSAGRSTNDDGTRLGRT